MQVERNKFRVRDQNVIHSNDSIISNFRAGFFQRFPFQKWISSYPNYLTFALYTAVFSVIAPTLSPIISCIIFQIPCVYSIGILQKSDFFSVRSFVCQSRILGKRKETMLGGLGRLLKDHDLTKTQLIVPAFSLIVHSPLRGLNKVNLK